MGLFGKSKAEKELEKKVAELEQQLLPEQQDIINLRAQIESLKITRDDIHSQIESNTQQLSSLKQQIDLKKGELIQLDEEVLYQSYSLYQPIYDFATSEEYKKRLEDIRAQQKAMIKEKTAVSSSVNWTVSGSESKGAKMTNDNIKQLLRSFNNECEIAIDKVKYSNVASMRSRIQKSYEALNKLNTTNGLSIVPKYFNLKMAELNLAIEYALKKQEEKEAQKKAREELREQQKLEEEIKRAREKIAKEKRHYAIAVKSIKARLSDASENEKIDLENKLQELDSSLSELNNEEATIDYREQNAKAGYVYIISNIGALGENVYKIGMTRRLEPMERVDELGDASVPFPFDVHALIFSDDAPKLESALHKAFDDKKVNMVNGRKEFFRVTLQEIEQVVKKNYDKTVDFIKTPPADQYRQTIAILKERDETTCTVQNAG